MNPRALLVGALVAGTVGLAGYPMLAPKPDPLAPAVVAPGPVAPPVFQGYVVICTQPKCPPCDQLKTALKSVSSIDIRYVDVSTRAGRKQYPVKATPTSILFVGGKEIRRKEGSMSAVDFTAWAMAPVTSTPVSDLGGSE